jgi:hypothetical protein
MRTNTVVVKSKKQPFQKFRCFPLLKSSKQFNRRAHPVNRRSFKSFQWFNRVAPFKSLPGFSKAVAMNLHALSILKPSKCEATGLDDARSESIRLFAVIRPERHEFDSAGITGFGGLVTRIFRSRDP